MHENECTMMCDATCEEKRGGEMSTQKETTAAGWTSMCVRLTCSTVCTILIHNISIALNVILGLLEGPRSHNS